MKAHSLPRLAPRSASPPLRGLVAIALCALALPARQAHGQNPEEGAPPVAGDRVRVEVATLDTEPGDVGPRWTARFLGADSLGIYLRPEGADSVHVAREDVLRVQVWVREGRATERGAAIGAGIGGVLGGTILAVYCVAKAGSCPRSVQANFAMGFALGALPGSGIGAAVGWLTPAGRWRESSLPAATVRVSGR